jgi:hypothetical protein
MMDTQITEEKQELTDSESIVAACESGVMSCPDCDGSGKCRSLTGEAESE